MCSGANAERREAHNFVTYERLGQSYAARLNYTHLPLHQGTMYYVNADVTNVLGYHATLTSQGTMADFTPPEPGDVGEVTSDVTMANGCQASLLQRCKHHVHGSLNHR